MSAGEQLVTTVIALAERAYRSWRDKCQGSALSCPRHHAVAGRMKGQNPRVCSGSWWPREVTTKHLSNPFPSGHSGSGGVKPHQAPSRRQCGSTVGRTWGWIPGGLSLDPSSTSCAASSKSLAFSGPQLPHLQNGLAMQTPKHSTVLPNMQLQAVQPRMPAGQWCVCEAQAPCLRDHLLPQDSKDT